MIDQTREAREIKLSEAIERTETQTMGITLFEVAIRQATEANEVGRKCPNCGLRGILPCGCRED